MEKHRRNQRVACLVSGGIDSMVLLHTLHKQKVNKKFDLFVIHFNHHLRGVESDRDEKFVVSQAKKLKLPVEVIHLKMKKGSGIQNRAREMRREHLRKMALQHQWDLIALGHQADDQIETLLMRIDRGAGVRGLRGMDSVSTFVGKTKIVRPLLKLSRQQIEKIARDKNIQFVEDSSNRTDKYLRNRVRHYEIPKLTELERREMLKQARELAKEKIKAQKQCRQFLKKPTQTAFFSGSVWFDIEKYFSLNSTVRFFVLEQLLHAHGFEKQLGDKHFLEIENFFRGKKNVQKNFGAAMVAVHGQSFSVYSDSCPKKNGKPPRKLFVNQPPPYLTRLIKPGDAFTPFGSKGKKKVLDYLTDRKVPRVEKSSIPLLLHPQTKKIMAVIGYEIDDAFRVQPGQKMWEVNFID